VQVSAAAPLPPGFKLLGTLRAPDETWSLAAVTIDSRCVTVAVGDVIADTEIIGIEHHALIVRRAGRLERWETRASAQASSVGVPTVSKAQFDEAMRNPTPLLDQVRVGPVLFGGRLTGFRAQFVKEGSLISSLGLRTGDVLRSVNGTPLDSPERMLELYTQLRQPGATRRFEVGLERNGQTLTQSVELAP
jgi:type II secretion system protein C